MTSPGSGSRLRSAPLRAFAPLALQLITVISVIALFALVWGTRSDDSDLHSRERDGVEYAKALDKLLPVLVSAQSNAVSAKAVKKEDFAEALNAVADVDEKFGSDFGTTNRWSGLRARIETLPEQGGDANGAFKNYGEATDLLLALYQRVAQASGLRSDADGVISYLQDAGLEEIPLAVVWAGRFQDQAFIAGSLPDPARDATKEVFEDQLSQLSNALTSMAVSRQLVSESGADVAADMASAVDNSDSGTFSTTLLQNLDAFQRGIEALAPPGQTTLSSRPVANTVAAQRNAAQEAAVELSPTLLDELGSQVDDRKSAADTGRILAAALLVIAVLAAVASFLLILLGGRRSRAASADGPGPQGPQGPQGQHAQQQPYNQGNPDYAGYPAGTDHLGGDPYRNNLDAGRDARRERVGVPR
ncbi:hypothetical protein [Cryptosporangium sp. NPDC048952]|uniref:hypothetical protein n=1 Tax=Cryptosporangium sp. NPDC048952 TaxID=3363961 RepID=UPI0037210062